MIKHDNIPQIPKLIQVSLRIQAVVTKRQSSTSYCLAKATWCNTATQLSSCSQLPAWLRQLARKPCNKAGQLRSTSRDPKGWLGWWEDMSHGHAKLIETGWFLWRKFMKFMGMVALGYHCHHLVQLNGHILIQSNYSKQVRGTPPHALPAWTRLSTLPPEAWCRPFLQPRCEKHQMMQKRASLFLRAPPYVSQLLSNVYIKQSVQFPSKVSRILPTSHLSCTPQFKKLLCPTYIPPSETKLSIHFPWFQHPHRLGQRWQQWLHCFGWTLPPHHCGTHAAQAAAAEVSSTARQGLHHGLVRWALGCSWKNLKDFKPQRHRNIDVPAKDLPGCAWLVSVASGKTGRIHLQLMDLCASANWGSSSPPKLGTAVTAEHKPQRTDHCLTPQWYVSWQQKRN